MDALKRLEARARQEPFFLASVLAAFASAEGLDDRGLAEALGCAGGDLLMIRLCRAPRQDGPGFREDMDDICDRFKLDFERLAGVVKRGQLFARLRGPGSAAGGFLMAARDREEDGTEAPPESTP